MSAADELRRIIAGHRLSAAVGVAASLGLADQLVEGPRTSDELADATGAHAETLYRLLRALAAAGIFREDDGRRFSLTELGVTLRTDIPDSLAAWAQFVQRPAHRDAWGALEQSVRTGENAFRLAHGVDAWEHRAQRPEESAEFDRAMAGMTRTAMRSVLDAYDFGRFRRIVDVGGGNGALLASLLERHPELRGILFDQPHVVAGVDLGERVEVVGGSFFGEVPPRGDAYVLKWILHDWEDPECRAILRNVRAHGATLVVIERVLAPPNEGLESKLSDLNMLVGPGGRERTLVEFDALFAAAGYRRTADVPTASDFHVLEGEPIET